MKVKTPEGKTVDLDLERRGKLSRSGADTTKRPPADKNMGGSANEDLRKKVIRK